MVWVGLLLFNGTFSTNRLYHGIEVQCITVCHVGKGNNTTIQLKSETTEYTKKNHMHSSAWAS